MSHAPALPSGGALSSTRRGWNAPANRASATEEQRVNKPVHFDAETPDPYAGEKKWPAWAVTLGVIVFCGAFWTGVSVIFKQLVG